MPALPDPPPAAPAPSSPPTSPAAAAEALLGRARRRRLALPGRGVELGLLDWGGDGPPALLLHANGFCKGVWGLVAEGLRPALRVLALDARGHGASSRPEGDAAYAWPAFAEDAAAAAEALLAELGAPRFAVAVGHSFGGTSLLGAAVRRPELFERLVLVDPVLPDPATRNLPERAGHVRGLAEAARRRRDGWSSRAEARAWFAERSLFAGWDPRALDLYVADGLAGQPDGSVRLRCPGRVESAVFAGGAGVDAPALARACRVPTRILWAEQGRFSRAFTEELAASMADGRVEPVAAGHLAPMQRPDLVVEAVRRFAAPSLP